MSVFHATPFIVNLLSVFVAHFNLLDVHLTFTECLKPDQNAADVFL